MVVCETRGQTERLGVWGSRLEIGAGITREGGYEASTISYCHLARVKSRVQLREGGISLQCIANGMVSGIALTLF